MEFTDEVIFEKQYGEGGIKSLIFVTLRRWSKKCGDNASDIKIKRTTILEEGIKYTDSIALLPEDAKELAQIILKLENV